MQLVLPRLCSALTPEQDAVGQVQGYVQSKAWGESNRDGQQGWLQQLQQLDIL